MNEKDLRRFQIDLKHHLAAEQEMFKEGLTDQPSKQRPEPEEAKALPTVTVTLDFPLAVKKRSPLAPDNFDLKITPKVVQSTIPPDEDFSISVKQREIPDFPLDVKERPQQP